MKVALALVLAVCALQAQDGPNPQGSATVARPRPKPADPADTTTKPPSKDDLPQIPSKLSPKATKDGGDAPDATFKSETNIVNIDVAVLDNKGNPIPNLKKEE